MSINPCFPLILLDPVSTCVNHPCFIQGMISSMHGQCLVLKPLRQRQCRNDCDHSVAMTVALRHMRLLEKMLHKREVLR